MKSILQDWVTELGLRHQGQLLTALRGCDGAGKEDTTKSIQRELRGLLLVPFDARELEFQRGFMTGFPSSNAARDFECFIKSMDHYPLHYIMHLLHAIEVIGQKHPHPEVKVCYWQRYLRMCKAFHLNPETEAQADFRLNEDRIALNTVEK